MPSRRSSVSILLLCTNSFLPLTFGWLPSSSSSIQSSTDSLCRSNSTHISWYSPSPPGSRDDEMKCVTQTRQEAETECMKYLFSNLMPYDVLNAGSLGFSQLIGDDDREKYIESVSESYDTDRIRPPLGSDILPNDDTIQRNALSESDNEEKDSLLLLPDGLSDGIAGVTVNMSLDAKSYPWTIDVPKEIYLEYVLSFSNLNEGRSNWRPLLARALLPTIKRMLHPQKNPVTIEDVVHAVNSDLWSALGNIKFKSGQTPLVYDPMSVIAFGYGSCTGLSILLVDALRAAGVPARVVGTPAWNGNIEKGNHSWVEVYCPRRKGDKWMFLEAAPAAGGVPDAYPPPCGNWFCTKGRFDGKTRVYAARLEKSAAGETFFPMTWDESNRGVPGEDRTAVMTAICSQCST